MQSDELSINAPTLTVVGPITHTGNENITGTLNLTGVLITSANAYIGNTLAVTGNTNLTGPTRCYSSLRTNGALTVDAFGIASTGVHAFNGATTVTGTLDVTSNTTVGGTLGVTGATTVGTMDVGTSIEFPGTTPLVLTNSRSLYTNNALVDSRGVVPNGVMQVHLFKLNNIVFFEFNQILGTTPFTCGATLNPYFLNVFPSEFYPANPITMSCNVNNATTPSIKSCLCNVVNGTIEIITNVNTFIATQTAQIGSVSGFYVI